MSLLALRILLVVMAANLAPPVLAHYLEHRLDRPVDGGRRLADGRPLLGPNKTVRGVIGGVLAAGFIGQVVGFGWLAGFAAGALAMLGDLATSFAKRRLGLDSGGSAPGLDQFLEGLLPIVYLGLLGGLAWPAGTALLAGFGLLAWSGSKLYTRIFLSPAPGYRRAGSPRLRARELVRCGEKPGYLDMLLNFEDALQYHLVIHSFFKLTRLYDQGLANALNFALREVPLHLPRLPEAFDGLRVLFLSDLHLDGLPGLPERLSAVLPRLSYDLCIFGGDYRMATYGPYSEALHRMQAVAELTRCELGQVGILGNHDCFQMIEPLTAMGLTVLVNDALCLTRDGQQLWLAGVDDPHYYRCEDLGLAMQDVPAGAFRILLAHSPAVFAEAAARDVDLMLSGHTHAGQICLPRLGAVFTHTPAPRRVVAGLWREGRMVGYTSAGVGASGVPLRFNCPGEAVIFTLRRGEEN